MVRIEFEYKTHDPVQILQLLLLATFPDRGELELSRFYLDTQDWESANIPPAVTFNDRNCFMHDKRDVRHLQRL